MIFLHKFLNQTTITESPTICVILPQMHEYYHKIIKNIRVFVAIKYL